jgi:hypothetical protein
MRSGSTRIEGSNPSRSAKNPCTVRLLCTRALRLRDAIGQITAPDLTPTMTHPCARRTWVDARGRDTAFRPKVRHWPNSQTGVRVASRAVVIAGEVRARGWQGDRDTRGYNGAYASLIGGLDVRPPAERNIIWLTFTQPRLQTLMVDRLPQARLLVGQLRAHLAEYPLDPRGPELVETVKSVSPKFSELWREHTVRRSQASRRCFRFPDGRSLNLDYLKLAAADDDHQQLVVFLPAKPMLQCWPSCAEDPAVEANMRRTTSLELATVSWQGSSPILYWLPHCLGQSRPSYPESETAKGGSEILSGPGGLIGDSPWGGSP